MQARLYPSSLHFSFEKYLQPWQTLRQSDHLESKETCIPSRQLRICDNESSAAVRESMKGTIALVDVSYRCLTTEALLQRHGDEVTHPTMCEPRSSFSHST